MVDVMTEPTDTALDAAIARGRAARAAEPRAQAVRYDRARNLLVLSLTNGAEAAFPPRFVQGLADATQDQIATVEILGPGYGLHWEELDLDLAVPGLLAGIFGTRAYMARQAGQATSPAKAAAARANGARGGRPPKQSG